MRRPPTTTFSLTALMLPAALLAAACTSSDDNADSADRDPTLIEPVDPAVASAEDARRDGDAPVRDVSLTAALTTVNLGDRTVETWAFNESVPAPEIRLQAGEVLRAEVSNDLPEPLTIHWHGIDLRNDMDGVPDLTQPPIEPGEEHTYEFTVPDAGTYFYHSHVGTQLDRGLYGPLIVDEPEARRAENPASEAYDRDVTLLLDDWIDGTGQTPDDVLDNLGTNAGVDDMGGMDHDMGDMDMGASEGSPLGEDTSDVDYPLHLINGRSPTDPDEVEATPGEKVRLRLINAGADTPFRLAVGGSRLTVISSDGLPVEPVTTDTLLVGMGERYDVVITVPDRPVTPIVAAAEGTDGQALAVLRSGPGEIPEPGTRPAELDGDLLTYEDLEAAPTVALPDEEPDRTHEVALTGDMSGYSWGIATPDDEDGSTLPVREGERVRLVIENQTMMWHPIHLHGHRFQVLTDNGPGPRKDTVSVPPMGTVTVDLVADNPGQWALHCHNIYHAESGMTTVLSYVQ